MVVIAAELCINLAQLQTEPNQQKYVWVSFVTKKKFATYY